MAAPAVQTWAAAGRPLRQGQQTVAADDPDPKALACSGRYLPTADEVLLRFVDGCPVSAVTTQFLA